MVVELQRATVGTESENVTVRVDEEHELFRVRQRVADNETWHYRYTVTPTLTGERLRLVYLLYRGDAPATPSAESAYREVHLWVNVTARS